MKAWKIIEPDARKNRVFGYTRAHIFHRQNDAIVDAERTISGAFVSTFCGEGFVIGGWFRDDYGQGADAWIERKAVRRLKQIITKGDLIVAASLQGFAADMADLCRSIHWAIANKVSIAIVDVNARWPGESGAAFMAVALKYDKFLKESECVKTNYAKMMMAEKGWLPIKSIELPYKADKQVRCELDGNIYCSVKINEEKFAIAKKAMELLSVLTVKEICERLNHEGVPSYYGEGPWTVDRIIRIERMMEEFERDEEAMKPFMSKRDGSEGPKP